MSIEHDITSFLAEAQEYKADDKETQELAKKIAKALGGKIEEVGPANDLGSRTFHISAKRIFKGAASVVQKVFGRSVIYDSGVCDYYKSKFKTPCQFTIISQNPSTRAGMPGLVAAIIDRSVETGRPDLHVIVYDGDREDYISPTEVVSKRYSY